jgi:hypothetical protein
LAYRVADRALADRLQPRLEPRGSHVLSEAEAGALVGLYRDVATGVPSRIVRDGDRLRVERGAVLYAESGTRLRAASGQRWVFADGGRGVTIIDRFGRVNTLERVHAWTPTASDVAALAGEYASAEADTVFTAAVVDGALVLRQKPDRIITLTPVYEGAFSSAIGIIRFTRDGAGRSTAFTVSQDRVWAMRFPRR